MIPCAMSLFLIFLLVATSLQVFTQAFIQPGIIIILNGTSSAGKTTLVAALHAINDTLYVASIDTYMRAHQHGSWETKCIGFYKEISEKAWAGHNVIVDTVLYHNNYTKYDALLKNHDGTSDRQPQPIKLIKILVYCPLDSIVAHVQARNRGTNSLEHRSVHTAFVAFCSLYMLQNCAHDIVIDTIDSSKTKAALHNACRTIHSKSPKYIKKQQKINRKIIHQFKLNSVDKMRLTPKHPWDLIVNTATDTPETIAQNIADFIKSTCG
jgi:deoxyadenosine/deoxycytidine kinase